MIDDRKDPGQGDQDPDEDGFLRRWVRRKAAARSGDSELAESSQAPDPRADLPESPGAVIETRQTGTPPGQPGPETPEPSDADMPPLESLDQDSDYSPFLSRGVSPELRQTALRQLFRQPKFNVETCLDDFQDDFRNFQPLGDIVTADMRHQIEVEAQRLAARLAEAEDRSVERSPGEGPRQTALGRDDGEGAPARIEPEARPEAGTEGPADVGPDARADARNPTDKPG